MSHCPEHLLTYLLRETYGEWVTLVNTDNMWDYLTVLDTVHARSWNNRS